MTEHVGRVVGGRYRLLSPLGSGASAEVYLADDVRLRRRVAVKVLHAALADDEAFLRRFRAEARAAAALSHPHIVAVYDWNGDEMPPYIVTEYLAGGSLRAMLDAGHLLSPSQALLVGLQAAQALDHAHRQGFVHRDIKPANLLFGADARLRIADFGLARAIAEAGWTEPSGAVVGTARYASPEQARGEPLDGHSDVYSLALVLVEAVTGAVPFTADTTIGTLMARLDRPLEVPEELSALAGVLEAAGQTSPQDRPDAGVVMRELMAAATDLPRPERLPLVEQTPGRSSSSDPWGGNAEATAVEDATDRTMLHLPAPGAEETGAPRHLAAPPDGTVQFTRPPGSPPVPGADRPPSGKRWLVRIVAVVAAVAVGIGAAWVFWQMSRPAHAVPQELIGAERGEVEELVDEFRWNVDIREEYRADTEEGEVIETDPAPGAELREGGTLVVVVSRGAPLVDAPGDDQLRGLTQEQAEGLLTGPEIGLVPEFVETPSNDVEEDLVIGLDEGTPSRLAQGSSVTVLVASGPAGPPIPDVTGWDFDDAEEALEELGYDVDREREPSDRYGPDQVTRTDPEVGRSAEPGGTVTVYVVQRGRGGDDEGGDGGQVDVPDLGDMSLEDATDELEDAGLSVGNVWGSQDGHVVSSVPLPGTEVPEGSAVNLVLL
jgi:eukaryotic-like serine/threonine-protein kinase